MTHPSVQVATSGLRPAHAVSALPLPLSLPRMWQPGSCACSRHPAAKTWSFCGWKVVLGSSAGRPDVQRESSQDETWGRKYPVPVSLSGKGQAAVHALFRAPPAGTSAVAQLVASWLRYSSDDKESAYNAGDLGSIPGSGRSPGKGNGNPLQYSCLDKPMDRGAWWASTMG